MLDCCVGSLQTSALCWASLVDTSLANGFALTDLKGRFVSGLLGSSAAESETCADAVLSFFSGVVDPSSTPEALLRNRLSELPKVLRFFSFLLSGELKTSLATSSFSKYVSGGVSEQVYSLVGSSTSFSSFSQLLRTVLNSVSVPECSSNTSSSWVVSSKASSANAEVSDSPSTSAETCKPTFCSFNTTLVSLSFKLRSSSCARAGDSFTTQGSSIPLSSESGLGDCSHGGSSFVVISNTGSEFSTLSLFCSKSALSRSSVAGSSIDCWESGSAVHTSSSCSDGLPFWTVTGVITSGGASILSGHVVWPVWLVSTTTSTSFTFVNTSPSISLSTGVSDGVVCTTDSPQPPANGMSTGGTPSGLARTCFGVTKVMTGIGAGQLPLPFSADFRASVRTVLSSRNSSVYMWPLMLFLAFRRGSIRFEDSNWHSVMDFPI